MVLYALRRTRYIHHVMSLPTRLKYLSFTAVECTVREGGHLQALKARDSGARESRDEGRVRSA